MKRAGRRACVMLGVAIAAAAGFLPAARAQMIPGYPDAIETYDPREVAMLPRFCIHTQGFREVVPGGNNRDQIDRWRALMGPTFEHLHYYCWGLMKTNRGVLLARTRQVRLFYLTDSIGEFDYVLRNAPRDFILLPEILTKKGENLVKLGRGPLAVVEFERAVEAKPDYWPPYAQMSDYFRETGETERARELLVRGLAQVPDAVALKRRLQELDEAKGRPRGAHPATPGQGG